MSRVFVGLEMKAHRGRVFAYLLAASLLYGLTANEAFGVEMPLEFRSDFLASYSVFAGAPGGGRPNNGIRGG
jgi:hypothetical protein